LEDIRRDLIPLEEQGKVEGFFNNVENVNRLGGLVEDIRDAMMEYQVCVRNPSTPARLMFASDFSTARYRRQELSTHGESHSSPLVLVD